MHEQLWLYAISPSFVDMEDEKQCLQTPDSVLISSLSASCSPIVVQGAGHSNQGVVTGTQTAVSYLLTREQSTLKGIWTLEATNDGLVGTLMCTDMDGQFDMQDLDDVLKKKVAVKDATGEYFIIECVKAGKKRIYTMDSITTPHTELLW